MTRKEEAELRNQSEHIYKSQEGIRPRKILSAAKEEKKKLLGKRWSGEMHSWPMEYSVFTDKIVIWDGNTRSVSCVSLFGLKVGDFKILTIDQLLFWFGILSPGIFTLSTEAGGEGQVTKLQGWKATFLWGASSPSPVLPPLHVCKHSFHIHILISREIY